MFSENNRISVRQLQILLFLDIFGTGVITLPARVCAYAGEDAWISVLIAAVIVAVSAYMITTVASLFKGKSFFEYTSFLLTRPAAVLISVLFAIKLLLLSAFELRFFGEIVRQTLLLNTPFWAVCGVMLSLSAYAAAKGYESRARLGEILVFIALGPVIVVFLFISVRAEYSNLLPVLYSSPQSIMKGGYTAIFAFTGIELCFLAFPYLNSVKKARKSILALVLVIGVVMAAIVALTTARFGVSDVKRQNWPVLEMMDSADMPGSFIERLDAIIMSFWIVSVFAIVNAGLFFSSLLLKDITGGRIKHTTAILCCIPVIFGLSFLAENTEQVGDFTWFAGNTLGVFFFFVLPFVMLIVARIKGRRAK